MYLPLSGNVTQSFPWANYFTINVGTSANPETERQALEVASYGRQLGRLADVVLVLLRHLPPGTKLDAHEAAAIADLKSMLHEIDKVKARTAAAAGPPTA
jgi:hypothetical protein